MTRCKGTATSTSVYVHTGDENICIGARKDGKNSLMLLLLSPFKGIFFVLAFPMIVIVTAIRGVWILREKKQTRLEQEHSRRAAFFLSFVDGLLYVAAFPLIIIGTFIKKLALGMMERQSA